ncbi:MAG: hypothetical protein KatS3mg110_2226 [Pirellulaceae bacterium]|nr:MAG: hypothetical protein KatS3mg110_2226 [Pirellulaceae bacterium]
MNHNPFTFLGWTMLAMAAFLALIGLLLLFAPSLPWLGRLPGDIRIERDGFRFYFPLTTCLVLSLLFSAVAWLLRFWRQP